MHRQRKPVRFLGNRGDLKRWIRAAFARLDLILCERMPMMLKGRDQVLLIL